MTEKPPLEDQIKVASESFRALGIFADSLQSLSEEISREYLLVKKELTPISEGATVRDIDKTNALLKMIEDEARSISRIKRLIAGHCQELRRNLREMVINNEQE